MKAAFGLEGPYLKCLQKHTRLLQGFDLEYSKPVGENYFYGIFLLKSLTKWKVSVGNIFLGSWTKSSCPQARILWLEFSSLVQLIPIGATLIPTEVVIF